MRWLVLAIVLWSAPARAEAPRLAFAGRLDGALTSLVQRRVGEPRYLAIADVFYRGRDAYLEIADLAAPRVIPVRIRRATLERRFGTNPRADVVAYVPGTVGLLVAEAATGARSRRHWYAEVDERGTLGRVVPLVGLARGEAIEIVGVDLPARAAWFAIHRPGASDLVLRRLDLGDLAITDPLRVALTPRGRDAVAPRVHAAPDFARFAVVEYYEERVGMAPGKVYVVDVAAPTFSVPAPAATYGVAFAPGGKYLYLGGAQRGVIARIDLAARRIDKQVAAPRFLHHLVISPRGTSLFAFASSSRYAVFDLPDLEPRGTLAHTAELAPAMTRLSGNGQASLDGAYFVAPVVETAGERRRYVIGQLLD